MVIRNIQAGENLKKLRKNLALSREILHLNYGFPRSTIKHWENGYIDRTSSKFKSYLNFIGECGYVIDIDWLLEGNAKNSVLPYLKTESINNLKITKDDNIFLTDVITILEQVSNFCYYINSEQQIMYFNKKSVPFLIPDIEGIFQKQNIKLKDICAEQIYEDCIKNYNKALNGELVIFDYPVQNSIMSSINSSKYNKMIYTPITNTRKEIIGVLSCLLTNL